MTAICSKCGRDCRTALALGKHEAKGCDGTGIPEVVLTPENHDPEDWKPIEGHDVTTSEMIRFTEDTLPDYEFSDRHKTKIEKCPKCNEIWADFLILNENTWVCLSCGCHFMPREKLNAINEWKLNDAERRRSSQAS